MPRLYWYIPGPSGAKQLLYRLCLFQKYIFYITFTEFWHKHARRVIFVDKQSSQILGKRKQEKWLTAERIILKTEMTLNTWHHAWLTDEDTGRKLRQYHNNKVIQHAFTMKGIRSRQVRRGGEARRWTLLVADLIHVTDGQHKVSVYFESGQLANLRIKYLGLIITSCEQLAGIRS